MIITKENKRKTIYSAATSIVGAKIRDLKKKKNNVILTQGHVCTVSSNILGMTSSKYFKIFIIT